MSSYTLLGANGIPTNRNNIKLSNGNANTGKNHSSMRKETRERLTVIVLCILWYCVSSGNNVIGKMVFNQFPYPTTVTMVQLFSITLYSGPFFKLFGIRPRAEVPRRYYLRLIIPLAMGKFLASVTSHISIWKVPVSYAHTVKGTMPLFTVILSQLILKERHTKWVYLSLLPIVTGVVIASFTELSFDLIGLICALLSTMGFSLQNIYSKKVLKDTEMHHLRLLHLLGRLALFMFLPVWVYVDFKVITTPSVLFNGNYTTVVLLLMDGCLNWLQNIIAFSVMSLVTPLTYSVSSAFKRIFVIGVSLFILGNPVTGLNILGMMLTCVGVLAYNRAKIYSRQSGKYSLLPMTSSSASNGSANGRMMSQDMVIPRTTATVMSNGGGGGITGAPLLDDRNSDKIMNLLLAQNGHPMTEPNLPKVASDRGPMWNGVTNKMMFV